MNKRLTQSLFRHPNLVVAPCKFGHGVFATGNIPADTTVEECHHLRIKEKDCSGILNDYVYYLEPDDKDTKKDGEYYSLPLGWGSIYNHANNHNIEYWHDTERDLIIFYTITDVSAGEQLFINYGKDWWETRELTPENDK
jgi:SET domain-containing protein